MASLDKISNENQTSSHSRSMLADAGQPQEQDKFEFLKELTSSNKHLKRPFYEHLFNVYTHLKEQMLPEEVCNAGLFHSIYGTEFYHFHNDRITRDVVRGYIGSYAEELVYIFCSLKVDRFDNIVNNTLGLSKRQQMDLCHIEYANGWDQKGRRGVDDKLDILDKHMARLEDSKLG